jgi:DNA-binding NtrC family response regulator
MVPDAPPRYNSGSVTHQVHTQLLTDGVSGLLVERSYRLRVVSGPDQGKEHVLDEGTTMVGTHADNDLVLTDTTVSRYHLEIRMRRDGIEIRDLDTTNGTKHGGARVGNVVLTGPSRLRLGKTTEVDVEPVDTKVDVGEWPGDRFGDVLGSTAPMKRLFALLGRAAPTEATILLQGETGTGKEAIAEAIHHASRRTKGPFVVVDCGSIPHELIASELFGHAKGSFTGAGADKQGLIEAANGGTLFLDEIGELALDLQPQLLRVIDRRQVRRVGETQAVDVDIRVIAATHRDLRAMVRAGQFREDLFYRLAVVATSVPPLRERKADIPALASWFAEKMGRGTFAQSPSLIALLEGHDWPGNVRELRNVVERALSLGESGLLAELSESSPRAITNDDDGEPRRPSSPGSAAGADVLELPFKEAKAALVETFERDYLTALLARHRGNISRAASEAGIDRNYIHRLVKKYGLEVDRG